MEKKNLKIQQQLNGVILLKEAKNLKFFWILALGLFFLGMYVSALAVQYPAYLKVHLAIDPKFVGNVGSVFALFSLGRKPIWWSTI